MDYYSILGVSKTATQDDIKRAYKKLAMKYHPDRGGDTKKFQEISQAYDTLGDPQNRAQYDAEQDAAIHGHQFHFHTGNPFDPFAQMFGGRSPFDQFFNQGQRVRQRNRDLNIRCTVDFKQSYLGTELEANYNLPSGKNQTVVIKVPAGIENGQVIRYQGMGDDSNPSLPRGDLNVTILVEPSSEFQRRGDDLISLLQISAFDAMIGCSKIINHLDDTSIKINLRPGVQHGTEFLNRGLGFRNVNSGHRGNLIIQVHVNIPSIFDPKLIEEIKKVENAINNISKSNT